MAVTAPEATGGTPPQSSPSPTTSAPADSAPASTEQATSTGAEAQEPKTAEISEDLIRQRIAEYDPREIAKLNRKYANLVGNEADRLADKRLNERRDALRNEWEADWRNRQEAAELRQLRDTNPELYVQREKELEERLAAERTENQRIRSTVDAEVLAARQESDNAIRDWAQTLPEPVQAKLKAMGQIDEGEWSASRKKFMQVASDLLRDHLRESVLADELPKELAKKVDAELAKRSKEIEAGVKAASAAESVAGEQTPDTGGGGTSGAGPMTQAEFDAIRHDPAQRRAAKDRIVGGVNSGLITR